MNIDSTDSDPAEQAALREELEALGKIAHALRRYRADAEGEIGRWEHNFARLPAAHQAMLPSLPVKIATARHCAHQNHLFLKQLLASFTPDTAPEPLCHAAAAADAHAAAHGDDVSPHDAEKVRYVFKNLMRDWSAEGAAERTESYGRMLGALRRALEVRPAGGPRPRVLVPGSGLGRLCAEVAALGCETLGNEFSYYMLLASSFVLNDTQRAGQWAVFPWLLNPSNHFRDGDQLRAVLVPDVKPAELVGASGLLGMAAGDFVEVFSRDEYEGSFDFVMTCFFLDTAHNAIEYMETIFWTLKPGGRWINLGPLLWHWADASSYLPSDELSLELSMADVEHVARHLGFHILERQVVDCHYMADRESMLRQAYTCVHWTAEKPDEGARGVEPSPHPTPLPCGGGSDLATLCERAFAAARRRSSTTAAGDPGSPAGAPTALRSSPRNAERRLDAAPSEAGSTPPQRSSPKP